MKRKMKSELKRTLDEFEAKAKKDANIAFIKEQFSHRIDEFRKQAAPEKEDLLQKGYFVYTITLLLRGRGCMLLGVTSGVVTSLVVLEAGPYIRGT